MHVSIKIHESPWILESFEMYDFKKVLFFEIYKSIQIRKSFEIYESYEFHESFKIRKC